MYILTAVIARLAACRILSYAHGRLSGWTPANAYRKKLELGSALSNGKSDFIPET
jgi:hypothetical protein